MAEPPRGFSPDMEQALETYLRRRLKPPHQHPPTSDTRWLGVIAALAGGYVVVAELTYKGTSTLTPVLVALGIGIVCLAAAHLLRHGRP